MARKASPATRRTGIRLDPVNDGVVRTPSERSVTAIPFHVTVTETDPTTGRERNMPERATLATERARATQRTKIIRVATPDGKSTEWVHNPADDRSVVRTATIDPTTGRAYDFTTDRWGNETNKRPVRLTTDPDGPLAPLPPRPKRTIRGDRMTTGRPAAKRASVDPDARPTGPRTTNADIDAIIRATGYTGVIDRSMRSLARDMVAHRASVAAYTA